MVNPPKIRHSKSQRPPVTIDLEAEAEAGNPAEAGKSTDDPAAREALSESPRLPSEDTDAPAQEDAASPQEQPEPESAAAPEADNNGAANGNADSPPVQAAHSDGPPAGSGARSLAAGIAGGLAVLLLGAGLHYAGVWPRSEADNSPALEAMQSEIAALKEQVSGLEASDSGAGAGAVRADLDAAVQRLDGLEQSLAALQQSVAEGGAGETPALAALQARLDEMEARIATGGGSSADQAALSQIMDRLSRAEGEMSGMAQSLAATQSSASENSRRLEELDQRITTLSQQVENDAGNVRLARIAAATALKSAIDRGGPFRAELDAFAAVAPDSPALADLAPHAETGIPTRASLIAAIPSAASEMVAAANPPPADAGFFDRLAASAKSLVSVRPVGVVEGTDAPAVIARFEAAVNAGDYVQAMAEYDSLPEPVRDAGKTLADQIRARLVAERIVESALADAIRTH